MKELQGLQFNPLFYFGVIGFFAIQILGILPVTDLIWGLDVILSLVTIYFCFNLWSMPFFKKKFTLTTSCISLLLTLYGFIGDNFTLTFKVVASLLFVANLAAFIYYSKNSNKQTEDLTDSVISITKLFNLSKNLFK